MMIDREAIPFSEIEDKRRYEILREFGILDEEKCGGINTFIDLSIEGLKLLFSEGLLDDSDRQNCAPPIKDFISFLEQFPEFLVEGYIVENERSDRRISITGMSGEPTSATAIEAFNKFSKAADEREITEKSCSCWYD